MYRANKRPLSYLLAITLMALLATPTLAQETETRVKEGQEYKMKYNEALELAKAKNYDQAYTAFETAIPMAEAAGDESIVKRSQKVLAQLDNSRGTRAFKSENYQAALEHHQKGIAHKNDYVPNHYGKANALRKLGRMEEALPIYQAVMQMDDRKSANAAEKTVRGHYIYLASSALSNSNGNPSRTQAQGALDNLDEMELYVEADADALYYKAEALKALGNYDQAIEMADKALAIHRGSRSDKAKIYFNKGESLMLQGATGGAQEAFTNALYGDYKPLAQHYLDELKGSGN